MGDERPFCCDGIVVDVWFNSARSKRLIRILARQVESFCIAQLFSEEMFENSFNSWILVKVDPYLGGKTCLDSLDSWHGKQQ